MFKSDSQGGEEGGYGGMGSSFSDKAIRLNFIRKVIFILSFSRTTILTSSSFLEDNL